MQKEWQKRGIRFWGKISHHPNAVWLLRCFPLTHRVPCDPQHPRLSPQMGSNVLSRKQGSGERPTSRNLKNSYTKAKVGQSDRDLPHRQAFRFQGLARESGHCLGRSRGGGCTAFQSHLFLKPSHIPCLTSTSHKELNSFLTCRRMVKDCASRPFLTSLAY